MSQATLTEERLALLRNSADGSRLAGNGSVLLSAHDLTALLDRIEELADHVEGLAVLLKEGADAAQPMPSVETLAWIKKVRAALFAERGGTP